MIRPININSKEEISLVAERMKKTLMDVMGDEKGSSYYTMEWLLERVNWHIQLADKAMIFLCEDENRAVIGQAIVRIENDQSIHDSNFAYFSTIYVAPEWRRRGIARLLIQKVHEWSSNKGLSKITYSTAEDHLGLICLLEQFGYQIIIRSNGMVRLISNLK